mgnify:CR=1 FL=1
MHHNYLVPNPSKFNIITNVQFKTLTRHKIVIIIIAHVTHNEPELVTRIGLLLVSIVDFEPVIHPIIIILEEAGGSDFLLR